MSDLERAVAAVVNDCLGVREGEAVLVVANPATLGLGERLRGEAGRAGADAVLALMAERATHGGRAAGAGRGGDGGGRRRPRARPSSRSRTPPRRKAAIEAGARIATLPGVTEEMLARVMSADMDGLRRSGDAVAAALDARVARRGSPARTASDLRLGLGGPRRRSPTPAS